MKKWSFVDVNADSILKENSVGKFEVYADESCIYFKHKHYTVISVERTETNILYTTECVRHNGTRHIKYETLFAVTPKAVGYCESLFIEE